jgi:hypothetical protein
VYRDRGFHEVPKAFASQLMCPCWRSDAPFPKEVLLSIAAKAEQRAKVHGRGGRGPKWAQELVGGTATRFDVRPAGPAPWSSTGPRRGGGGGNPSGGREAGTGSGNASGSAGLGWNATLAAALPGTETAPLLPSRRRTLAAFAAAAAAPPPLLPGGPPRKRRGGRPGSADADAGERVYTLPMHLRDHGVPPSLGWLCLPHFFLVGVPKSGTTALYEMVAAHPQVTRR